MASFARLVGPFARALGVTPTLRVRVVAVFWVILGCSETQRAEAPVASSAPSGSGTAVGRLVPQAAAPPSASPSATSPSATSPEECTDGDCAARTQCDPGLVTCARPAQFCARDELPSVSHGCWGRCVPVAECETVPDCASCSRAGLLCVTFRYGPKPRIQCVEVPATCTGSKCECVGADLCGNGLCRERAGKPGIQCVLDARRGK